LKKNLNGEEEEEILDQIKWEDKDMYFSSLIDNHIYKLDFEPKEKINFKVFLHPDEEEDIEIKYIGPSQDNPDEEEHKEIKYIGPSQDKSVSPYFIAKQGKIPFKISNQQNFNYNERNFFIKLSELFPVLLVDKDGPVPKLIQTEGQSFSISTLSKNLYASIKSYYKQIIEGINFQHLNELSNVYKNKICVQSWLMLTLDPEKDGEIIDTFYGTQFDAVSIKGIWASARIIDGSLLIILFFKENKSIPLNSVNFHCEAIKNNNIHLRIFSDYLLNIRSITNFNAQDVEFYTEFPMEKCNELINNDKRKLSSNLENAKQYIAKYMTLEKFQNVISISQILKIIENYKILIKFENNR